MERRLTRDELISLLRHIRECGDCSRALEYETVRLEQEVVQKILNMTLAEIACRQARTMYTLEILFGLEER
jgi:hypothetical protein